LRPKGRGIRPKFLPVKRFLKLILKEKAISLELLMGKKEE
jgi:hypothetical protein